MTMLVRRSRLREAKRSGMRSLEQGRQWSKTRCSTLTSRRNWSFLNTSGVAPSRHQRLLRIAHLVGRETILMGVKGQRVVTFVEDAKAKYISPTLSLL